MLLHNGITYDVVCASREQPSMAGTVPIRMDAAPPNSYGSRTTAQNGSAGVVFRWLPGRVSAIDGLCGFGRASKR